MHRADHRSRSQRMRSLTASSTIAPVVDMCSLAMPTTTPQPAQPLVPPRQPLLQLSTCTTHTMPTITQAASAESRATASAIAPAAGMHTCAMPTITQEPARLVHRRASYCSPAVDICTHTMPTIPQAVSAHSCAAVSPPLLTCMHMPRRTLLMLPARTLAPPHQPLLQLSTCATRHAPTLTHAASAHSHNVAPTIGPAADMCVHATPTIAHAASAHSRYAVSTIGSAVDMRTLAMSTIAHAQPARALAAPYQPSIQLPTCAPRHADHCSCIQQLPACAHAPCRPLLM